VSSEPVIRRVGRRSIRVSNAGKVLWPDDGITKVQLIDYYEAVAGAMLPHVRERLMTLERYPDGIGRGRFFSKDVPAYFPDWIDRETVGKKGGTVTHVVCKDKATLVYLANQASITLHVGLSRTDRLDYPDQMIFDLDPSTEDFSTVRSTALEMKSLLEDLGLAPYAKTTGSKGLHVVVPLDRKTPFGAARRFAGDVAGLVAARAPDLLTTEQRKVKRSGPLYLDHGRNAFGATAAAPYTVRARPGAPVAVPLAWEEVEGDFLRPDAFGLEAAAERATNGPDPWRDWRRRARSLKRPRARLDARLGGG
jgi:bifunctional non-homologous end joining protein LigD